MRRRRRKRKRQKASIRKKRMEAAIADYKLRTTAGSQKGKSGGFYNVNPKYLKVYINAR